MSTESMVTQAALADELRYIAAILEANASKFAVPDHIPQKARKCREAADLLARTAAQPEREAVLEAVRKVRDGYASQAKFADHEPASYYREFVQRLDAALTTPAPAVSREEIAAVARGVLQDRVWSEARSRYMADATQQSIEHHLIVVAAEHAVRAILSRLRGGGE